MPMRSCQLAALSLMIFGGVLPALADRFDERATLDVLQIQLVGRDLYAIDGRGGVLTERLEIGETLNWRGSRGRVGIVLTDRRFLGASSNSSRWQSERYLRTENPPAEALLGEQVAVIVSNKRILGLDANRGTFAVVGLGPLERIVATEVGANVAVVVTTRRALGIAPRLGGFVEIHLTPQEKAPQISVSGNVATVLTPRRLLTFRGPAGSWGERRRKLR